MHPVIQCQGADTCEWRVEEKRKKIQQKTVTTWWHDLGHVHHMPMGLIVLSISLTNFPTTILFYYWGKDPCVLIPILWTIRLQIVLITAMCINLTMNFLTRAVTENISLKPGSRPSLGKKTKKHISEFEDSNTFKGNCCQCCFCVDRILLKGFVVRKAPFSGFS